LTQAKAALFSRPFGVIRAHFCAILTLLLASLTHRHDPASPESIFCTKPCPQLYPEACSDQLATGVEFSFWWAPRPRSPFIQS